MGLVFIVEHAETWIIVSCVSLSGRIYTRTTNGTVLSLMCELASTEVCPDSKC
jgi:hypothetical protein